MSIKAKSRGYLFDEVEFSTPDKSAFDLSHRVVMSAAFDNLYPILNHSCLPGETYELNLDTFFRTSPLVAPIMQDIDVKFYWFWCPYRVIFPLWRRFISNGDGTVSNSSPLAGANNVVSLPFITSADLFQRGNFSNTSYYRGERYHYANRFHSEKVVPCSRWLEGGLDQVNYKGLEHGLSAGSLADYLGIPDDGTEFYDGSASIYFPSVFSTQHDVPSWVLLRDNALNLRTYSSLPFRAYNKIWYDWFRDENLFADTDTPLMFQTAYSNGDKLSDYHILTYEGEEQKLKMYEDSALSVRHYYNPDPIKYGAWDWQLNVGLLRKCWSKDYLTSSLTNPQRGQDVLLPLGDKAPLAKISSTDDFKDIQGNITHLFSDSSKTVHSTQATQTIKLNEDNLYADLSNATSATLNSLRVANAFQKFLEKMARCGTRYMEQMLSMFDVVVPDSASDRCTLIGADRIPLQIQTNSSQEAAHIGDGTIIPQGTQVANASGSGRTGFRFTTDEHGILMGLMCIEPRAFYGSSLHRDWFRKSYLDFAWPMFANLGEQEVYASEVMPQIPTDNDLVNVLDMHPEDKTTTRLDVFNKGTFGYQSRYCEYKYRQDAIHGTMKTYNNMYTLSRFPSDMWFTDSVNTHLTRDFILCNVEDYQNIFNEVVDLDGNYADHFTFDFHFDFKAIRPLPVYGTPSL